MNTEFFKNRLNLFFFSECIKVVWIYILYIKTFSFCIEELKDYFLGDNTYGTTDEMLHKYYDAFI